MRMYDMYAEICKVPIHERHRRIIAFQAEDTDCLIFFAIFSHKPVADELVSNPMMKIEQDTGHNFLWLVHSGRIRFYFYDCRPRLQADIFLIVARLSLNIYALRDSCIIVLSNFLYTSCSHCLPTLSQISSLTSFNSRYKFGSVGNFSAIARSSESSLCTNASF